MADIFTFFEEGIKSYIEKSALKYTKTPETIFNKDFDNIILNPLFINDITLFKNLIQKNKLKFEIWISIGELLDTKIQDIIMSFKSSITEIDKKITHYKERIKKTQKYIEDLQKLIERRKEAIQDNYNEDVRKKSNEKKIVYNFDGMTENENKAEEDNLEDVKCEEYSSKNNAILINKINRYNINIEDSSKSLENYEHKIKRSKKKVSLGNINLLKLRLLHLTINILINEINKNELNNENYNRESNYKLLDELIVDLIEKSEEVKEKINVNYVTFIQSFVIELALIINIHGYKDINVFFLNKLLYYFNNYKNKHTSDEISNLISYIEKVIKNPDSFLCPNAFLILKNASYKKIRPRSRNNSFDKNEINLNNTINNNNDVKNNNKKEKETKIDDYFKKKKSESDEEEEEYNNRFSNIISFKNSNQNNTNNYKLNNNNYHSQFSFCLKDNNSKIKFNRMSSALSNNSLLGLENLNFQIQTSNLLNSSRLSGDDSMSVHSQYKHSSLSELLPHDSSLGGAQLGINSRLASQKPFLRISKKEKNTTMPTIDQFMKNYKKEMLKRKNSNEKQDNSLNKQINTIVNNKFYNNENLTNDEKNKNTTASDNKKNYKNNIMFSDEIQYKDGKKSSTNEVLVSKTPVKNIFQSEENNNNNNNDNLEMSGIKKNLNALFNQKTAK